MKKIGEIKGIPVVEGNENEVTKNQIHYKEDSGSIQLSKRGNDNKLNSVTGSSSGGGSSRVEYYKILDISSIPIALIASSLFKGIRIETHEMMISTIYPIVEASINGSDYFNSIDALAFIPFGNKDAIFDSFKDAFYVLLPELNPSISKEELDLAFNTSFIPITEEEFYNLD